MVLLMALMMRQKKLELKKQKPTLWIVLGELEWTGLPKFLVLWCLEGQTSPRVRCSPHSGCPRDQVWVVGWAGLERRGWAEASVG